MAKLPFIVEPRLKPRKEIIGTEESGQIEIERKGFLTAAEKAFVQAQASEDTTTQEMIHLTRQVGKDLRMDMQSAYELLSRVMQGDTTGKNEAKIYDDYQKEISELLGRMAAMGERKLLVQALCMLVYRVDAEIDADTAMETHPDLLLALSELYAEEENRSTRRLQETYDDELEGNVDSIDALEKK
jgi:hypothetical protein